MIKVSVMYPNTPGARFDHEYYRDKHMPLVKARLGDACKFYTVDKGLAGGAPARRPPMSACATSMPTRFLHPLMRKHQKGILTPAGSGSGWENTLAHERKMRGTRTDWRI